MKQNIRDASGLGAYRFVTATSARRAGPYREHSTRRCRPLANCHAVRLLVGLVQGGLLSLLVLATLHHVAPFDGTATAMPLSRLISIVPGAFLLLWGRMRIPSLTALLGMIAAATLATSLHEVHQAPAIAPRQLAGMLHRLLFDLRLFVLLCLALAAERDRRRWPSYPSQFETAWDLAILLILCFLFIELSCGVLWLMAGPFAVAGMHGFTHLLPKPWTWPLVSCLAFAVALSFGIEGERLVVGVRRLALALFGLLLPVLGSLAVRIAMR